MHYAIKHIILSAYTLLFCMACNQESLAATFPAPTLMKYTPAAYSVPRPTFRPHHQNGYVSLPDMLERIDSGASLFAPRPIRRSHYSVATPIYKPTQTAYNDHPVPVLKAMASDTFIWPVQGKILSRFGENPVDCVTMVLI